MESQLLAAKLRIRNPNIHELPYIETVLRGGLPNELPEGGEMGGGGVFRPIHEIAELPPWEQFMNLARVLETITQRLNSVEAGVAALNAKLDTAG
jgi:hypothetical protein